jgi:prevent-host-death family protein
MAVTVNIHEAKTQLSDLLKKAMSGEEVIIAKANKPIVRLVPVTPAGPKKRIFGLNRGMIHIGPDFDAPLPSEFWEGRAGDPLLEPKRKAKRTTKAAKKRAAK